MKKITYPPIIDAMDIVDFCPTGGETFSIKPGKSIIVSEELAPKFKAIYSFLVVSDPDEKVPSAKDYIPKKEKPKKAEVKSSAKKVAELKVSQHEKSEKSEEKIEEEKDDVEEDEVQSIEQPLTYEELDSKKLNDLKIDARDLGINTKGMDKDKIIKAILSFDQS